MSTAASGNEPNSIFSPSSATPATPRSFKRRHSEEPQTALVAQRSLGKQEGSMVFTENPRLRGKHRSASMEAPRSILKSTRAGKDSLNQGKKVRDRPRGRSINDSKPRSVHLIITNRGASTHHSTSPSRRRLKHLSKSQSLKDAEKAKTELNTPKAQSPEPVHSGWVISGIMLFWADVRGIWLAVTTFAMSLPARVDYASVRPYIVTGLKRFAAFLAVFLTVATYVQWFDSWMPESVQGRLRVSTDLGSRFICSMPVVGSVCPFVCRWDDYSHIFPTVCSTEDDAPNSAEQVKDGFGKAYGGLSEALFHNGKMHEAPMELKRYRNTMILSLNEIKALRQEDSIQEVDFDAIEAKIQLFLDISWHLPENLFTYLSHVGIIPDAVLFQTKTTRTSIKRACRSDTVDFQKSSIGWRKISPHEALRIRFLDHVQEWITIADWLIEPGSQIQVTLEQLESLSLLLKGMISSAITQISRERASRTASWNILKRIGYYHQWIQPEEVQYLTAMLHVVEDLHQAVSNKQKLFEYLWKSTQDLNFELNGLRTLLGTVGSLRYDRGAKGKEQLESFLEYLDDKAENLRHAAQESKSDRSQGSNAEREAVEHIK